MKDKAESASVSINAADRKILEALEKKLGLGLSQIFRMAIRALARNERLIA